MKQLNVEVDTRPFHWRSSWVKGLAMWANPYQVASGGSHYCTNLTTIKVHPAWVSVEVSAEVEKNVMDFDFPQLSDFVTIKQLKGIYDNIFPHFSWIQWLASISGQNP